MNQDSLDRMNEALKKFGESVGELARSIIDMFGDLFSNVWEQLKSVDILYKKLTRKRFIKLLMSQGIQRNEATKIAWKVHAEKGKYTVLDYLIQIKNEEK